MVHNCRRIMKTSNLILATVVMSYANHPFGIQGFSLPKTTTSSRKTKVKTTPRFMMNIDNDGVFDSALVAQLSSVVQETLASTTSSITLSQELVTTMSDSAISSSSSSYSQLSYFTVLGLYLMSFPGLISIISRSTKAKMKRKTYVSPGLNYKANTPSSTVGAATTDTSDEAELAMNKEPLSLKNQAIEIMAYMKGNNYAVQEMTNTTITFEGVVQRSLSQAFFLTFCTILGLLSLALVLQIQFKSMGAGDGPLSNINFFYLAFLSPYAGIYYWNAGDRVDTIQIQLSTDSDETMNEVTIYGPDDEMERMWRTLQLQEKDMIPIPSILNTPTTTGTVA